MPRKRKSGDAPLRNEEIAGFGEEQQEASIRASALDPSRSDAAREYIEAHQDEARNTPSSARDTAGPEDQTAEGTAPPGSRGTEGKTASRGRGKKENELEKHWGK
ncbi:MAG TPA: hypothetical protein VFW66_13240 [Gemmatimonadales bacterium]|nr:hypothetical protein [Gemmatimonadales bacterium]